MNGRAVLAGPEFNSTVKIRSPKFFPRIYRKDKPSHRLSTAYLLNVFFGPASTVKRFTSSTVQRDQEGARLLSNFAVTVGFNRPNNRRDIDHGEEIDCDCTGGIGGRVCVRAARERWHRGGGASVRSAANVQLRAATAPAGLLRPRAGGRRRLPGLWLLPAAVPRLRLSSSLRPPLLSARSSLALTRSAQLARSCAGALACWRLQPAVAKLYILRYFFRSVAIAANC